MNADKLTTGAGLSETGINPGSASSSFDLNKENRKGAQLRHSEHTFPLLQAFYLNPHASELGPAPETPSELIQLNQEVKNGKTLREGFASLNPHDQKSLKSKVGEDRLETLFSISENRRTPRFWQEIMGFTRDLKRSFKTKDLLMASMIYGEIAKGERGISEEIQRVAELEHKALIGDSSDYRRREVLLGRGLGTVTDMRIAAPAVFAPMLGQAVNTYFKGVQAFSRGAMGMRWFNAGLTGRTLAGAGSFSLETFAFAQGGRLLFDLTEGGVPWGVEDMILSTYGAGITLLGLKGFGFLGNQLYARAFRISELITGRGLGSLSQAAIQQTSGYLGLVGVHHIEERAGLINKMPNGNPWLDALETHGVLQFGIGGAKTFLGPRLWIRNHQYGLQGEMYYRGDLTPRKTRPTKWFQQIKERALAKLPSFAKQTTPDGQEFWTIVPPEKNSSPSKPETYHMDQSGRGGDGKNFRRPSAPPVFEKKSPGFSSKPPEEINFEDTPPVSHQDLKDLHGAIQEVQKIWDKSSVGSKLAIHQSDELSRLSDKLDPKGKLLSLVMFLGNGIRAPQPGVRGSSVFTMVPMLNRIELGHRWPWIDRLLPLLNDPVSEIRALTAESLRTVEMGLPAADVSRLGYKVTELLAKGFFSPELVSAYHLLVHLFGSSPIGERLPLFYPIVEWNLANEKSETCHKTLADLVLKLSPEDQVKWAKWSGGEEYQKDRDRWQSEAFDNTNEAPSSSIREALESVANRYLIVESRMPPAPPKEDSSPVPSWAAGIAARVTEPSPPPESGTPLERTAEPSANFVAERRADSEENILPNQHADQNVHGEVTEPSPPPEPYRGSESPTAPSVYSHPIPSAPRAAHFSSAPPDRMGTGKALHPDSSPPSPGRRRESTSIIPVSPENQIRSLGDELVELDPKIRLQAQSEILGIAQTLSPEGVTKICSEICMAMFPSHLDSARTSDAHQTLVSLYPRVEEGNARVGFLQAILEWSISNGTPEEVKGYLETFYPDSLLEGDRHIIPRWLRFQIERIEDANRRENFLQRLAPYLNHPTKPSPSNSGSGSSGAPGSEGSGDFEGLGGGNGLFRASAVDPRATDQAGPVGAMSTGLRGIIEGPPAFLQGIKVDPREMVVGIGPGAMLSCRGGTEASWSAAVNGIDHPLTMAYQAENFDFVDYKGRRDGREVWTRKGTNEEISPANIREEFGEWMHEHTGIQDLPLEGNARNLPMKYGGLIPPPLRGVENQLRDMGLDLESLRGTPLYNQSETFARASVSGLYGLRVALEAHGEVGIPLWRIAQPGVSETEKAAAEQMQSALFGAGQSSAGPGMEKFLEISQRAREEGKESQPFDLQAVLIESARGMYLNSVLPFLDYNREVQKAKVKRPEEAERALARILPYILPPGAWPRTGGVNISVSNACAGFLYALWAARKAMIPERTTGAPVMGAMMVIGNDATHSPYDHAPFGAGFGTEALLLPYKVVKQLHRRGLLPEELRRALERGELKAAEVWDRLPQELKRNARNQAMSPFTTFAEGMIPSDQANAQLFANAWTSALVGWWPSFRVTGIHAAAGDGGKSILATMDQGIVTAVMGALQMAARHGESPDLWSAHNPNTRLNNAAEIYSIYRAFRYSGLSHELSVMALKALFGHGMGDASGLDAVMAGLAMVNQVIPGNTNFHPTHFDPRIEEAVGEALKQFQIQRDPVHRFIRSVLISTEGFLSANAAAVFSYWPQEVEPAMDMWKDYGVPEHIRKDWGVKAPELRHMARENREGLRKRHVRHRDIPIWLGYNREFF